MSHRAHDYRHLISRWRGIARESGLAMRAFAEESGYPVFFLKSKALAETGGLYFSAGIHGDEPAATEGLVTWAEKKVRQLNRLPLILFPCLNPWGLANNSRLDAHGRDLNRVFQHDEACAIHTLKQIIEPYRFNCAMMLHEDYDGQGVYLYELQRAKPYWGEALLAAARPFLPIEPRTRIDGRKAAGGLVRRKVNPKHFQKIGFPEAIYLHQHHAERTFTAETPSEFALDQRVRAQVAMIGECARRAAAFGHAEDSNP
jgi:hypothetical protein